MMKDQKRMAYALSGLLLTGCLAACSAIAISPKAAALQEEDRASSAPLNAASAEAADTCAEYSAQDSTEAATTMAADACAEYSAQDSEEDMDRDREAFQENVRMYEPFGMTYDARKDELRYHGKLVRWFEDYYPIDEECSGGIDFFNENGVIDVRAIRDLSQPIQNPDGSIDPSGKVTGLQQFSDEAFAARDIDAIKNPPMQEAIAGEPVSAEEMQEIAAEYAAYGITYDTGSEQWYFHGEKVRFFLDVLISNGKSLDSGDFHGTIRNSWKDGGTVDIYTVRDFQKLNAEGNGTLTDIKKYSQQEFDARTKGNRHMLEEQISGPH